MRIFHTVMQREVLHTKEFPMGSIVLELDNGTQLVCNKFNHSRKQKLELLVWLPNQKKWVRTFAKNEYTEIMWNYYRKHKRRVSDKKVNYAQLMQSGDNKSTKIKSGGARKKVSVPNSVKWATTHPFQGGSISPR